MSLQAAEAHSGLTGTTVRGIHAQLDGATGATEHETAGVGPPPSGSNSGGVEEVVALRQQVTVMNQVLQMSFMASSGALEGRP